MNKIMLAIIVGSLVFIKFVCMVNEKLKKILNFQV